MTCPLCRRFVPSGALRCPACGAGLAGPAASAAGQRQRAAAAVVNRGARATTAAGTPAPLSSPGSQALPPRTLLKDGRYQLGPVLGQGCFGITYRAVDRRAARLVAIKEFFPEGSVRQGSTLLPPASLGPEGFVQERAAFIREASILARFRRPGIVAVYEVFRENGTAYMVMQYVAGKTLVQLLRERGGPLPVADAVRYVLAVADALGTIHEQHVLHRDVKPGNIIVTPDDEAVLIDFGAARSFDRYQRTSVMTAIGTPGYAPLEQWGSSNRFGPASDVYALAATLYHLITGRMPPVAADRALQETLIPPRDLNPDVPPALSDAVVAALAVHMDARPQSMAQFAHSLRQAYLPAAALQTLPRPGAQTASTPLPMATNGARTGRLPSPQRATPSAAQPAPPPARSIAQTAADALATPTVPPPETLQPDFVVREVAVLGRDLVNATLALPLFTCGVCLLTGAVPLLAMTVALLPGAPGRLGRRALRGSAVLGWRALKRSVVWMAIFAYRCTITLPLVAMLVVLDACASTGTPAAQRRFARRRARYVQRLAARHGRYGGFSS
jgi:serine/threonine protein kinase